MSVAKYIVYNALTLVLLGGGRTGLSSLSLSRTEEDGALEIERERELLFFSLDCFELRARKQQWSLRESTRKEKTRKNVQNEKELDSEEKKRSRQIDPSLWAAATGPSSPLRQRYFTTMRRPASTLPTRG